jgi:hypothetical protein
MNRLASRCCDFMDAIIEHMTTAPLWRGESEEGYISIRDCLEKYILSKIGRYAFQSVECPEDDAFLLRRMALLSFIQTKVPPFPFSGLPLPLTSPPLPCSVLSLAASGHQD